mmetsp:Transcript_56476/g.129691  ORF Transcript_56476/g.129691 Transcript_56476/m.129691 type:complete len:263 (-) Transcript_56476:808-1596(-)
MGSGVRQADDAGGAAAAGREVHEDHQPEHRRGEVHDQCQADRQVCRRAGRPRRPRGHRGGDARWRRQEQVPDPDPAAAKDRSDGDDDDGRGEAGHHLQRHRRQQGRDPEAERSSRAADAASRALRAARHRPAQGHLAVRPAGHRQDARGARGGEPHRCVLHPRHRIRARAEVRGRGSADGARAVPDGALQEGVHRLPRRGGRHWRHPLRRWRRRRQRGAAHDARDRQPARRLRGDQPDQGGHGDKQARHPRHRAAPSRTHRS